MQLSILKLSQREFTIIRPYLSGPTESKVSLLDTKLPMEVNSVPSENEITRVKCFIVYLFYYPDPSYSPLA